METRNNVGLILKIEELIKIETEEIVSSLNAFVDGIGYKKRRGEGSGFSQTDAWYIEVSFLKKHLENSKLNGDVHILFEYMLPGENTERPDVLMLFEDRVYSLEFKTIGRRIQRDYITQFIDYRTILQEYHTVCIGKGLKVESNLIMCGCDALSVIWDGDVREKIDECDYRAVITKDRFQELIDEMSTHTAMDPKSVTKWVESGRSRSKKIWEQGLELKNILMSSGTDQFYSKIKSIPYSDLSLAQDKINELVKKNEKKIIFVSGVPGAGKTLIGMLTLFGSLGDHRKARYYTGNGALENVLSNLMKSNDISLFTSFRANYIKNKRICEEEVLIFDEAQRFWNETTNKLAITDAAGILSTSYKNNVSIVCLIGNGQRPMSGEGGIEAWIEPLKIDKTWRVYAPKAHKNDFIGVDAEFYEDLYLDVAKRQHFVDLSGWVEAVLAADLEKAKKETQLIEKNKRSDKFGILLTRSLGELYNDKMKLMKHKVKRESESKDASLYLFGVLCSSKNKMQEMPKLSDGVIQPGNTYIDKKDASSWYSGTCCNIEKVQVATETFCQGLEVDLPIIFFGGDYLLKKKGNQYTYVMDPSASAKVKYGDEIETIMEDTYRILLTRATEEMILVIPHTSDGRFDDMYQFFKDMGINEF